MHSTSWFAKRKRREKLEKEIWAAVRRKVVAKRRREAHWRKKSEIITLEQEGDKTESDGCSNTPVRIKIKDPTRNTNGK